LFEEEVEGFDVGGGELAEAFYVGGGGDVSSAEGGACFAFFEVFFVRLGGGGGGGGVLHADLKKLWVVCFGSRLTIYL